MSVASCGYRVFAESWVRLTSSGLMPVQSGVLTKRGNLPTNTDDRRGLPQVCGAIVRSLPGKLGSSLESLGLSPGSASLQMGHPPCRRACSQLPWESTWRRHTAFPWPLPASASSFLHCIPCEADPRSWVPHGRLRLSAALKVLTWPGSDCCRQLGNVKSLFLCYSPLHTSFNQRK